MLNRFPLKVLGGLDIETTIYPDGRLRTRIGSVTLYGDYAIYVNGEYAWIV